MPGSRLNNSLKFLLININILFAVFGLVIVAFAFYLYFANWGDLDPGFFIGMGTIILLFGVAMTLTACIGCQGIAKQTKKYGELFVALCSAVQYCFKIFFSAEGGCFIFRCYCF